MPIPEIDHTWSFTSSGVGTRIGPITARELSFYVECPAGSTAAVEIQTARTLESTSVGIVLGSSLALASSGGTATILSVTGCHAAVFPRVISMTAAGLVTVRVVGN